jgi:DNA-binding beta-propeller fold protein YncE
MTMKKWLTGLALIACLVAAGLSSRIFVREVAAQNSPSGKMPVFEVDKTWPQLPNNWNLGNVSKIAVDRHDNVWLIHRPRTVAADKTPAPPVVELDPNGKFIQAWGGDASGYDWPDAEHNVFVDYKDNVWISGSSPSGQSKTQRSDDMILKFDNKGKFLMEIGGRSVSMGSKDPKSVNKPGDLFVSAKTNELYVADGYGNRRVIVFDADTGKFKRMWGAFGKPPVDDATSGGRGASGGPLPVPGGRGGAAAADTAEGGGRGAAPALDTEGPGSPTFASPVHGVMVSNDDIVYVVDRSNRRVQLFSPDGKYLTQLFVNRAGPSGGSASGLAFSPDKDQQFLYVSDYGNSHVVVVDRKKLQILYQFAKRGAEPGNFQGIHHIAVDSKGNLYAAEVAPGARAQKFNFKGLSATLPPNALSAADLAPKRP